MSIELAEKIKAMAKQQIDTAALVDKLEARIAVLEKFTNPSEPIEYAKYIPSVTAGDPEKRGRGRPKKV